jgi:hypothetical protein
VWWVVRRGGAVALVETVIVVALVILKNAKF